MKTITRNADGSLSVRVENTQKSLAGFDVTTSTQWDIQPHQVDAHRTDPAFESAIDPATLAKLNQDRADRAEQNAKKAKP